VADHVTIFLSGDVMIGRGIDQILQEPCDPILYEPYIQDARDYIELAEHASGPIPRCADLSYPWGDALAVLDGTRTDARIINLETSITRSEDPAREKSIHYRVSPENARCLAAARIDACSLGNNHMLDWGERGLVDTLDTLDRLGIARSGAGHDLEEAARPAVLDLADRDRIVVFSLGSTDAGVPASWAAGDGRPGVHITSLDPAGELLRLRRVIEPWRGAGSVIVVSLHWGPNWGFEVPSEHRRFAHSLVEEVGVHVVHGHSSHHVKGIEVYGGQPILYGCGDLLTDYEGIRGHERFRGDLSLLYLVTLDERSTLAKLEMIPMRMYRFRIARAGADDTRWLATTLARCGDSLHTSVTVDADKLSLKW
jgi:poly-gamma-glutamate synthesis protein (capsule biosynthesis protein)